MALIINFGRNQKSFSFTDDRILKLNNGFFDEIKRYLFLDEKTFELKLPSDQVNKWIRMNETQGQDRGNTLTKIKNDPSKKV
jgi:hypothetical protein